MLNVCIILFLLVVFLFYDHRATDGCFFDKKLLEEASRAFAGQVDAESPLSADPFFSYKHSVRPNAVQWYTLFSWSPLSPRINSHIGRLPPPDYIRRKLVKTEALPKEKGDRRQAINSLTARSFDRPVVSMSSTDMRRGFSSSEPGIGIPSRNYQNRSTFWNYIVNPIRVSTKG